MSTLPSSIIPAARPQPGWLLFINSLMVMALSLFLAGFWLSAYWHWDPMVWIGAIFCFPLSLAFAWWQYRATFCLKPRAANTLATWMLFVGGLIGVAGGMPIVSSFNEGLAFGLSALPIFAPFIVVSTWLIFSGLLMRKWWKLLAGAVAIKTDGAPPPPVPFAGSDVATEPVAPSLASRAAIALAAAAIVAFGYAFGNHDTVPQLVMHGTPEEARLTLPAGASDVCVRRGSRGVITYSFAIDEPGFWQWTESGLGSLEAEQAQLPITPVDGSFTIYCCGDEPEPFTTQEIHHGWCYRFQREDRATEYAYDADNGHAYYNFHAH